MIQKLLRSRRTEDRIQGVNRLIRSDIPERQGLLLAALSDRSSYVAALAAEELGRSADLAGARAMVERFEFLSEDGPTRDPGCHVRAHLAFGCGRLEYQGAVDALRVGIRTVQIEPVAGVPFDTGAHLRANCALALAQLHAPDALRDISLVLFETDPKLLAHEPSTGGYDYRTSGARKAAAQALRRLGDPNVVVPLTLKLKIGDRDSPDVLQECIQTLAELEDPRLVEIAGPYLSASDPHLAAYAGLMLARTRDPQVVPLLLGAAQRLTDEPLEAVLIALGSMRIPESDRALEALRHDDRRAVRAAVASLRAEQADQPEASADWSPPSEQLPLP